MRSLFVCAPFCMGMMAATPVYADVRSGMIVSGEDEQPFSMTSMMASHQRMPGAFSGNILNWLKDRNGNLVKNVDLQQLKTLMANVNRDPASLQRYLDAFPQLKDPENFEKILGQAKQLLGDPENLTRKPDWKPEDLEKNFKKLLENPGFQPGSTDLLTPKVPEFPFVPKLIEEPKETPMNKQTEQLAKWMQQNLGKSQALQGLVQDLTKFQGKDLNQDWLSKLVPNSTTEFNSILKNLQQDASKLGSLSDLMGKLTPGKIPTNLPNVGFNTPNVGSMPSFNTDGIQLGSIGFLIGFVAAGFIAWYLLQQHQSKLEEKRKRRELAELLGQAPEITRPKDLIPAFEWISLRRMGQQAAYHHHLQLQKDLIRYLPEQESSIRQLTQAYETLRYQPSRLQKDLDREFPVWQSAYEQLRGVAQ